MSVALFGRSTSGVLANVLAAGDVSALRSASLEDVQAAYVRADQAGEAVDRVRRLAGARIVRHLDDAMPAAKEGETRKVAATADIASALGKESLSSGMPGQYRYAARLYLDLDFAGNDPAAAWALSTTPKGLADALKPGATQESFLDFVKGHPKVTDKKYREIFGEDRPAKIAATVEVDGVSVTVLEDNGAPVTREQENVPGTATTGDNTDGKGEARVPTPKSDLRSANNGDRIELIGQALAGLSVETLTREEKSTLADLLAEWSAVLAA